MTDIQAERSQSSVIKALYRWIGYLAGLLMVAEMNSGDWVSGAVCAGIMVFSFMVSWFNTDAKGN